MNFKKLFPIVIVLSLFFAGSADAKSFPVIKDGKAVVELVPDKNPACIEAAKLVEKYLSKSTGSSMKVPAGSPQILFKIEKGKLDIEGFRFSFPTAGKMVITGGGPNGVKYGALEFVEQFMGVRFLYPGPAGEHVPKLKNLSIPMKEFSDAPKYYTRILDSGRWHKSRKAYFDWYPYLRGEQPKRLAIGHNLYHMFPVAKYGRTNPDFYPVINGKRHIPKPPRTTVHWQPCMTNPAVIKEAVRMICDAFAKDPNLRTWSLGQTDGYGYCECENCKKFYSAKDTLNDLKAFDRSLLYVQFCNRIAEEVTKKYPDAKFSIFAYGPTSFAPAGIKLHHSLVPVITYDRLNWVDPERKAKDLKRQKEWSAISAEVCWWDYFGSNRYILPRVTPHHAANQLREGYNLLVRHAFIQHTPLGVDGYTDEQIWAEGPMAYVTYKMLWDPFQDENKILDDWYRAAVGPEAAPYLRNYFERLEKFWTKDMPRSDWFKRCGRTYLVPTWHDYLFELDKDFFEKSVKDLDMVCKLAPEGDCKTRAEYFKFAFQDRRNKCEFWLRNHDVRSISPKKFVRKFFREDFNNGLGDWKIVPRLKAFPISYSIAPKAGPDGSDALDLKFLPAMRGTCLYKLIPVKEKGIFRMEVKYRCIDVEKGTVALISAEWCNEKGENMSQVFYSDIHGKDLSGKWATAAFNFTTPDTLPAYLKIQIGSSYSKTGKILFDDFSIQAIP